MKVLKRVLITVITTTFLLAIALYCYVAYYHKDGFSYGTYINGISACDKTIEQINNELLSNVGDYEGLTIYTSDGESYKISASSVELKYDYADKLLELYYGQPAILWGLNFVGKSGNIQLDPVLSYNRELFEDIIDEFPFITHMPDKNRLVKIKLTLSNGYELVNKRQHVLNEELAKSLIIESFDKFEPSLNLEEAGCYGDLELTTQNVKDIELFKKIDAFQNRNIVYKFGDDEEVIDKTVAYSFIKHNALGEFSVDINGDLVIDEDAVYSYVDSLCEKYDTFENRTFKTTEGRTVTVSGGNYGNKLDSQAEKDYLLEALKNNINEVHEPLYEHEAPIKGHNDLGDTYIEIDLTNQRMYYYQNGEQKVATDIVSGCTRTRHSTIQGTYYIYNHRRNTTLIGPDYQSFVRYWLGIYKGYGIHDASWRSKYGGEIYKTSGSHGCVNTPYENIKTMWELVEDGTPCVVFY